MKKGIFLFALLLVAGCSDRQPYVTPARLERGLVVVLPGIEGPSRYNRAICAGLSDGGTDCAIQTYDWTSFLGPLYNLRASTRNRRQADHVADLVIRYHMSYPGRPVYLVGHSGGGAIAVWTAELLPPEHKVDGIILLAASLSPYYMLDLAIQRSRLGVVSFYSDRDWFLLGTNVTGTMDGEMSTSAGRTGFLYPESAAKPKDYARLFQVPWDRQMSRAGNTGGHLTSGSARFVAKYVAPLIQLKQWDEPSIERVMASGNGVKEGAGDVPAPGQPATVPVRTPLPQGEGRVRVPTARSAPSATPAPSIVPRPTDPSPTPAPAPRPTPTPTPRPTPIVPFD